MVLHRPCFVVDIVLQMNVLLDQRARHHLGALHKYASGQPDLAVLYQTESVITKRIGDTDGVFVNLEANLLAEGDSNFQSLLVCLIHMPAAILYVLSRILFIECLEHVLIHTRIASTHSLICNLGECRACGPAKGEIIFRMTITTEKSFLALS